MKTLITHINPHLDDIVGIWLFKKYHPDFKDSEVEFISASHGEQEESEDRVFVGTGGGRFDEHKEGLDSCAGTLVYEYLKQQNFIPEGSEQKALEKLINWNYLIDTGRGSKAEFDEYSVQSFIRTKDNFSETSLKSTELGREVLDRILEVLIKKEQALIDWENRVEFETRLGKGYAVTSETVNREFCREQDGDLYLMVDPKNKGVQFFAPEVDIEAIYNKVKIEDKEADWFLHQSHHMVICGSSSAPESKLTKLSFEQLIEAAKTA